MKMIVMMMTSFLVIDDYKMMTIMTNYEDDCDADDKLFCYWWLQDDDNDGKWWWWWQALLLLITRWWPTMKTRRTVPGQIVINVFSTNLVKREIRLNKNAKKKLELEYWKLTRWNLNIILIKRAITKLIKIFIIISTDRTSHRHHHIAIYILMSTLCWSWFYWEHLYCGCWRPWTICCSFSQIRNCVTLDLLMLFPFVCIIIPV